MSDVLWDEAKEWFGPESNGYLPDGYVAETTVDDWESLIHLAQRHGWALEYSFDGETLPMPPFSEIFASQNTAGHSLRMWPVPEILVIFSFWSPDEITFDIDLREINGQERLDQLCGFLAAVGTGLGKPVRITPEGMNMAEPFLGYDPQFGKVTLLPGKPPVPHALRTSATFTLADNWQGGFYELAIEVGPVGDDETLQLALQAVWRSAAVAGCFASRAHEPENQDAVPCTAESLDTYGHLRGRVTLPNGVLTVCGAVAIREDNGSDWLDFYLPLGALDRADCRVGGYAGEAGTSSLDWRRPIDSWLAEIARQAYSAIPFRLALIGFEVSGIAYAADLTSEPDSPRGIGYLIPDGSNVRYLPAEI